MTINTDVFDDVDDVNDTLNTINVVEETRVKAITTNIVWSYIENLKHCYDILQDDVKFLELPQTTPLKYFNDATFSEFKHAFLKNKSTWYVSFKLSLFVELSIEMDFIENTMSVWVQSPESGFCIILDRSNLKTLGGTEWKEELFRRRKGTGKVTKRMCNLPRTLYTVTKLTDVLHTQFGNNIFDNDTAVIITTHTNPPATRTRLSDTAYRICNTVINEVHSEMKKAAIQTLDIKKYI